jgi:thiamine-monophosphate kinase
MTESRRLIRLGPGAEFDMIRRFIGSDDVLPPEVRVGPGDDAAVLQGGWVVSTDLSVEDVHFRRDWLSDEEVGYRAGVAALSDLAAMAATPVAVLVSLAGPASGLDIEAVQAGVRAAAAGAGASVIGGDLARSPGPLTIDVVVLGCTAWPVLRDGAEPGDEVWVTGWLGGSAAAVQVWESGTTPSASLREAYARPRPRVEEAKWLVDREWIDALIDVSDGLAGDVGHMAAASGVQIMLNPAATPVAPAAVEALGREAALEAALHGGEDYELCFAIDPGKVDPAAFERRFGIPLTRVGTVSEGKGVWLSEPDGSRRPLERGGFDHWGPSR